MNAGLAYILHSPYFRTNVFPSPLVDIPFVQKTGFFRIKGPFVPQRFPAPDFVGLAPDSGTNLCLNKRDTDKRKFKGHAVIHNSAALPRRQVRTKCSPSFSRK
ncbi:hypothetical protein PAE9249_01451 [Paenibacillus sp. CECT 9249]|nr:hypothetical protein PAE9249_01451 [Paenibacillus sp. CECT 9249]